MAVLAAKGRMKRLGAGERSETGVASGAGGVGVANGWGRRVDEVGGRDRARGEDGAAYGLGERDSDGRRRLGSGGE